MPEQIRHWRGTALVLLFMMVWMALEPWNWAWAQSGSNGPGGESGNTATSPQGALGARVAAMRGAAQAIATQTRTRSDASLALSRLRDLAEELQADDA
ncbi:MAG: hypothetical protein IT210_16055, partial [Armatimonadetes bacterium]|nr:hypothetical protein [Armatimonadota bacterium]